MNEYRNALRDYGLVFGCFFSTQHNVIRFYDVKQYQNIITTNKKGFRVIRDLILEQSPDNPSEKEIELRRFFRGFIASMMGHTLRDFIRNLHTTGYRFNRNVKIPLGVVFKRKRPIDETIDILIKIKELNE